ncbi:MAG: response regulator [Myxococcales bacterium]|nr:response regulator [Myxococcales bacterium]
MGPKSVLILEPNVEAQAVLIEALTSDGFNVYGIDAVGRIVGAVERSGFEIVLMDVWTADVNRAQLIESIREKAPDTTIVLTGKDKMFPWLLDAFRAGADDFLLKPFELSEVRSRVKLAYQRRQAEKKKRSVPPPLPSGSGLGLTTGPLTREDSVSGLLTHTVDEKLLRSMEAFHKQALETFLQLERDLTRAESDLAALRGEQAQAFKRELLVLSAHPDPGLGEALERALSGSRASHFAHVLSGGEALERVAQEPIDIVFLSEDLPDIPGSILSTSVTSQNPAISVILVNGWATAGATLQRNTTGAPVHAIRSAETFLDAVNAEIEHHRSLEEARHFAQRFKERHQNFIRALAEIKKRIARARAR